MASARTQASARIARLEVTTSLRSAESGRQQQRWAWWLARSFVRSVVVLAVLEKARLRGRHESLMTEGDSYRLLSLSNAIQAQLTFGFISRTAFLVLSTSTVEAVLRELFFPMSE
eukprot:676309-Pelagomonas_calceolata.AAC.1